MKTVFRLLAFVAIAMAITAGCFAADAATTVDASTTDFVSELICSLATKYPWLVTLFSAVGVLRVIFKPIMSAIHARVQATASTSDDEKLATVEAAWWFKAIAYMLDWTASIKLPAKTVTATGADKT